MLVLLHSYYAHGSITNAIAVKVLGPTTKQTGIDFSHRQHCNLIYDPLVVDIISLPSLFLTTQQKVTPPLWQIYTTFEIFELPSQMCR